MVHLFIESYFGEIRELDQDPKETLSKLIEKIYMAFDIQHNVALSINVRLPLEDDKGNLSKGI